jgi:hypothetical protein
VTVAGEEVHRKIWRSERTYAEHVSLKEEKNEASASLKEIVLAAICFDLEMKKHTVDMDPVAITGLICAPGSTYPSPR